MMRLRSKHLSCFYCGKRSDTYFNPGLRQFDCRYCNATNHLDKHGEITNPPVEKVMAGSSTIPQYTPRTNNLASSPPANPDAIFCDACLKHQRLFVASIAQYEADGNKDVSLDRDYYRYRRNLIERYPQCCEQCKPRVESAIRKADYTAKTDYTRKMVEKSRDPRNWASSRRTWRDHVHSLGKMAWYLGLILQLVWHMKELGGIALMSGSGMRDPDDVSWTTSILQMVSHVAGYLPEDETLIYWSLVVTMFSVWWNPKFVQVLRGFDRHLRGISQWYGFQIALCAMRFGLVHLDIEQQSKNAQAAAHVLIILMVSGITSRALHIIRTDTTPLFGNHKEPPPSKPDPVNATREGFMFRKEPAHKPSMAEAFNEALPRPGETPEGQFSSNDSSRSTYDYQFIAAPRGASSFSQEAEADAMEWQPTGSTTLPRALRTSDTGAGDRPFGQDPVQDNNRPFYYRAPEAPTNPARQARNNPKQPFMWQSHGAKNGFGPQSGPRHTQEFQPPRFFAQQPGPDREHDEQLAGLAGGLSFDDGKPNQGGWFGFGKK